jgi:hypothetical protein
VVDGFVVRQEHHALFDRSRFPIGIRHRQTESVRSTGRVATFQNSAMF